MGIDFQRFQDHTKTNSMWSNETSQGFIELEGVWEKVQVPQGAFKPKLSLLPYLLTGVQDSGTESKIGLDARYTLTPQLTRCRQLQPGLLNGAGRRSEHHLLSHVAHSIPDQRPFFLEGANNFF